MGQPFIGSIAHKTGIPIQTIRYYEQLGLLPRPRRALSGYRLYDQGTVDRLQFVKKAQNLGLRLEDIKEILELADRGRCPCGHVQRLLRLRLQELRQKITDWRLLERRLTQAVGRGCPPHFRPKGKAICPTIDRQPIKQGR